MNPFESHEFEDGTTYDPKVDLVKATAAAATLLAVGAGAMVAWKKLDRFVDRKLGNGKYHHPKD